MPYTSISFDDASNIVNEAGLSKLVDMNILTGGWANSNYKLSLNDNTDIVLKIWDEQTIDEVFDKEVFLSDRQEAGIVLAIWARRRRSRLLEEGLTSSASFIIDNENKSQKLC